MATNSVVVYLHLDKFQIILCQFLLAKHIMMADNRTSQTKATYLKFEAYVRLNM